MQQVLSGLTTGCIYAALAIALVLVFRSTGTINFAQGAMATVAAFVAWQLHSWGVPVLVVIPVVLVLSFFFGVGVETVLIRRLPPDNHWAMVIFTFGLFLTLAQLIGLIWGHTPKSMTVFSWTASTQVGRVTLTGHDIVVAATLAIEVIGLWWIFQRTRLGLAMRSSVSNREVAQLMGINVKTMTSLGWGMASVLGTVCALLAAPRLLLEPGFMFAPLVYALAAVALGGMDSPLGAVLGSLVIGVTSNLASTYLSWIGSELAIGVPLAIIVVVLLIRPQGMFGSNRLVRV